MKSWAGRSGGGRLWQICPEHLSWLSSNGLVNSLELIYIEVIGWVAPKSRRNPSFKKRAKSKNLITDFEGGPEVIKKTKHRLWKQKIWWMRCTCMPWRENLHETGKDVGNGCEGRRRVLMKLFTTSHLGLDITSTSIGKQDIEVQSKFRADLLKLLESRHPNKARDLIWCAVTESY